MEFKGTKGEWKQVFKPTTEYITARHEVQYGLDGECVAEFVHNEHDAKLIAASPDLLEALQELVNIFDYKKQAIYNFAKLDIDKAKQAIEKALK